MITPTDREYQVMPAGYIRDKVILANFRGGLRSKVNPQTGVPFTEDEIALATRPGSRWYREAQAIDDYGQGRQRNALWLINQLREDRASSRWLLEYHAQPLGLNYLLATGGSGFATVTGTPGTVVHGSTVFGAPGVYTARAPNGTVVQVFITGAIDADGSILVTMACVSTGSETNLADGTILTWITRDPNMAPTCVVTGDFRGGTNRETDTELFLRIRAAKRFKPAIGNDAQMREWGRAASNAIEDAFIYPCAILSGTTVVCITAKRAGAVGPLARIPTLATHATATGYLVPPLSPLLPPRSFVLVVLPVSEPTNLVLKMKLSRGSDEGWADTSPFPKFHATTPKISSIVSPTVFRITCPGDATLPNLAALATATGDNIPAMMLWDEDTSRFVSIANDVLSVEDLGSNVFEVTTNGVLTEVTPALNMIVCPDIGRRDIIAEAVEAYFDTLGPQEMFDVDNDSRGGRCVRFPEATDEKPYRAGATVATRVIEALGGSSADAVLDFISLTEPTYPSHPSEGPNMLTLGTFGVYPI